MAPPSPRLPITSPLVSVPCVPCHALFCLNNFSCKCSLLWCCYCSGSRRLALVYHQCRSLTKSALRYPADAQGQGDPACGYGSKGLGTLWMLQQVMEGVMWGRGRRGGGVPAQSSGCVSGWWLVSLDCWIQPPQMKVGDNSPTPVVRSGDSFPKCKGQLYYEGWGLWGVGSALW